MPLYPVFRAGRGAFSECTSKMRGKSGGATVEGTGWC